jgi:hypothetical protein
MWDDSEDREMKAEKDSKNYNKGQYVGSYSTEKPLDYYLVTPVELTIIEDAENLFKTLDGARDFKSVISCIKKRKEMGKCNVH